ncbi:MAG: hypothetical protein KJ949_00160 [Nanoarchaeota archaeon]|nr:hypothetical protein [Nanoarchaeota archaeon]
MKKEEIDFLKQLVKVLEDSVPELEKAFGQKDYERFSSLKKNMLQVQEQIATLTK